MFTGAKRTAIPIALLLFALVVLLRLGASESWGFGPQDLERFSDSPHGFDLPQETAPFFLMWSRGDGQAFMSIAADLNGDGVSSGLGLQSYRMSRIAHSVLARVLALGRVELLPYGIAAASFAAYGGLLVMSVQLADSMGLRAVLLGLSPAAVFGTTFDTAEGLGTLLVTIALTSSTLPLAILAGALLGISRPSYGTALLASRTGPLVPAATIFAGVCLQVVLVFGMGIEFAGSGGNIVIPFTGFLRALPTMHPITMASAVVVLLMAAVLSRYAIDARYRGAFRLAAAASALLAFSVGPSTFVGPMSPLRVTGALFVLLVVAPLFSHEHSSTTSREEISAGELRFKGAQP